ncbi:MAG TPA: UDP-N-acetylmuramoyl-tripeptide--D-alanyl-D-alanine ligase, partial [bacterium (Candidatus Stahlbacteria)]|nr:UDP-N-acetylmuramoyl-tripeptide--D-alanyl-D-alanine ligase [Candidatus Stahlbacteria bacterium]
MFELKELIRVTGGRVIGSSEPVVTGISIDSRRIESGNLFIAIRGEHFDGHDFVGEALRSGRAAMVEYDTGHRPIIIVEDTIRALGLIGNHYLRRFNVTKIG